MQKVSEKAANTSKTISEMAAEAEALAKKVSQAAQPAPVEPVTPPAAGLVDPMQLWGSLTQQFQTIAATAMKDAGTIPAQAAAPRAATKAPAKKAAKKTVKK